MKRILLFLTFILAGIPVVSAQTTTPPASSGTVAPFDMGSDGSGPLPRAPSAPPTPSSPAATPEPVAETEIQINWSTRES